MRILLLVAIAGLLGLSWSASTYAQETSPAADGQVRGLVYHDVNGNGMLEEGEPNASGPPFELQLTGEDYSDNAATFDSGGFVFYGVPPGRYTLTADLGQHSRPCVAPLPDTFSYEPLASPTFCADLTHPWDSTSSDPVAITVPPSSSIEVNFGAQPIDMATVAGGIILEDQFAPVGTTIEARFGDTICGQATSSEQSGTTFFQMDVFGAGERPGCPSPGDELQLTARGIPAGTVTWYPFAEPPETGYGNSGFILANAVAMQHNAWYWGSSFGDFSQLGQAGVQAMIGTTVCGESTLGYVPILGYSVEDTVDAGFGKLIVPSEDIQPGCGRPGATVTLTVNGAAVGSMPWQPGLQEVRLDLSKAGVKLPPTGSAGPRKSGMATILIALATALAAIGSTAVALSLAKVASSYRR